MVELLDIDITRSCYLVVANSMTEIIAFKYNDEVNKSCKTLEGFH